MHLDNTTYRWHRRHDTDSIGQPSAAGPPGSPGWNGPRLAGEHTIDDGGQGPEGIGDFFDVGGGEAIGGAVGRRDRFEQLADRDRQGPRQSNQHICARIRLRQLNPADVLVIQPGELSQTLLGQLAFEAQTTELSS